MIDGAALDPLAISRRYTIAHGNEGLSPLDLHFGQSKRIASSDFANLGI
jgi:hypothetical protein